MNKKKALLIGLVLVNVLLVGVLVGVLAGGGSRGGDPTPAAPSAPSTPVNTTMDDVVAGTGAIATSQTPGFEGVGTRYPATCVGAIQATAEWAQKVFQSTERRDAMRNGSNAGLRAFTDEIAIAPGAINWSSDKRNMGEEGVIRMLVGSGFPNDPLPVASPRVQDGVVQVLKCSETDKTAAISIIAPLDDVESAHGLPYEFYGWLNRTYQLQVVDGSWRLVHIIELRDKTPYQQLMKPPAFKATEDQARELVARPATDGARDIIGNLTLNGQGIHYFQNKNGEWGQAS